jgi:hypothetical protein
MADATTNDPIGVVTADFYFAIIPEWVLALPVSSNAIRAYCVLRRFADNTTGECYPSRKTLAMRSRLSVSTLDRSLKELVDNGAITVLPRKNTQGDWTSNLYTVRSLPNGGVSLPVMRPRVTGGQTGVVTGGEGTRAIKTKTNNKDYSQEAIDRASGIGMGNSMAMTGQPRQDLVDLCEHHSEAFTEGALEAYDTRIKPRPVPRTEARSSTWHEKYD